jgi:hypothetical protein
MGQVSSLQSLMNLSLVSVLYVHKHKAMFLYHGTILANFIHMCMSSYSTNYITYCIITFIVVKIIIVQVILFSW